MSDYHIARERDQLFRRLELLLPEMKSISGKVTAHQMLLHLSDGLRGFLGDQPAAAEGTVLHRTVLKWLAFHLIPWPEREPEDEAALARYTGPTPPGDFHADFARLVALLQRFDAAPEGGLARHPLFGTLSRGEWGTYMYLHMDWHLSRFGL